MMRNLFQEERQKFQPRLPRILSQIECLEVVKGDSTQSAEPIKKFFPQTANKPLIQFRTNSHNNRFPLRVGVVLSGGQAPGGHNVITGLFDALKKIDQNSLLFGFTGGISGVIENRYEELNGDRLNGYRNMGGFDVIGSGRTKMETPEQFDLALKTCNQLNLNGLVIIGGDDSNTNAALLAEYFLAHGCSTCVIGVPKTIDGDLKNELIEISFGFDTACKVYSESIGNICRDACSSKKYTHFIKLMGRSASHITLECALQTHPNMTIISEEVAAKGIGLNQIVDCICTMIANRAQNGQNYGVVLIPEGLIEFIPEMEILIKELNSLSTENNILEKLSPHSSDVFAMLPSEIASQLLHERDPHGNVQVSLIATEQLLIHLVEKRLKTWPGYQGKFKPLCHFLGYEGRSSYPSNFDANYCYALGFTAIALIHAGLTGYMSALQKLAESPEGWQPIGVPLTKMIHLEERKGKQKPVIQKAHVDLQGEPFIHFAACREDWMWHDAYRYPGPLQFFGPPSLSDETTFTLKLEQKQTIGAH